MPFTFSHPALILPFKYLPPSWVSFTGLVTGSMVPDLEYIIVGTRTFSHTWTGILWFDLPLALLVAFIFHSIIRDKLISHLPSFLYRRFARFGGVNWNLYFSKNKVVVIFSILLGTFTHVFWDSFTNISGYFVLKFQTLQEIVKIIGPPRPLYVQIWNLSSIAGALVLAIAVYLLPKEHIVKKNGIIWFWIEFFAVTALLSGILLTRLVGRDIDAVSIIFLRSALLSLLLISAFSKKNIKNKLTIQNS